jgi:hypothetical protein
VRTPIAGPRAPYAARVRAGSCQVHHLYSVTERTYCEQGLCGVISDFLPRDGSQAIAVPIGLFEASRATGKGGK